MALGKDGNFYGSSGGGGLYLNGAICELTQSASGWTSNILYNFTGASDGRSPAGRLVFDQSGNLYGMTQSSQGGGGVVFQLSPSTDGWTFNVIHNFSGLEENWSTLGVDGAGNIYGTDGNGYWEGSIFKLSPSSDGWVYTSLHDFTGGDDGGSPTSILVESDGTVFGTTYHGGEHNNGGVVFQITP